MKNLSEKSRAESAKKRCDSIKESIAAADSAIAEKRAIIAASVPDETRAKAAKMAVEDALAIQATGGDVGDLDALRAELGAAEAAFAAEAAACRTIVGDAETAIAGLSRRRDALKQELDDARKEHAAALLAAFEADLARYQADYANAVHALVEAMSKAEILQRISQTKNAPLVQLWYGGRFVPPPRPFREIEVPAMSLWDKYGSWNGNTERVIEEKAEAEIAAQYAALA
jgi:chromosome segregation ATPase